MNFEVTLSENKKYIIGKVFGKLNKETAQQLAKEYVKMINSTGIKLILNDVRGIPDEIGIVNEYDYAYRDVNSFGLPKDIKSAIVTSKGDLSHNFHETLAKNAGFNIKVFDSIELAVSWLLTNNS